MQAPPQEPKVEVDGVDVIPLTKNVTLLRGTCSSRLKFEIEYGRKRGTTDNSYLVKVIAQRLCASTTRPLHIGSSVLVKL